MKLTKTCARFLRKHGGTILAVAASVGVVATAIETGRATTKAKHELMAQAHKDWYYAMMSYIMGDDSDAEEESK